MKNSLTKLDFQLAYLAMLTKKQIKPLSRWEKRTSSKEVRILKKHDLKVETVQRKLLNGKHTSETIFSTKSRYIDIYLKNFDNQPVAIQQSDREKEGFLFGYPSCCVKNFVENGYTKNPYIGKEQEILFHWVCPHCRITPSLIPYYQKVHNECKQLFSEAEVKLLPHHIANLGRKALPVAAAFLLASGVSLLAEDHWLPVADNPDNDYLSYREEILLGTHYFSLYPTSADSIAKSYKTIIDSLPRETSDTTCYAIDNYVYGIYQCPICGEWFNMGYVAVYNPLRNLEIDIPYMALHFMEHGSFSYAIGQDTTRIDIELLKEVLSPLDIDHLSVTTLNDNDNDGLNNPSELYFETDPENPNTHNIGIDDGQEITEAIIEHISDLPTTYFGGTPPTDHVYLEYCEVWGLETCNICGQEVNMGYVDIINPIQGTSLNFPIIGLHYISHGRFAYAGSTNQGEIDPIELATVLDIDLTSIDHLPEIAEKYEYQLINFPNPFTGSTTISFFNTKAAKPTKIKVYNLTGQLVKELVPDLIRDRGKGLGVIEAEWDGTDEKSKPVPSGIYLYKLEIDGKTKVSQKMLLLR
ncbi:MAG: T9SS type A sorting domain-containing protein [Candidatus Cloacimonadota bacterium]|nr:T9SS type A sorting domain-containing protein [Candidatus Cloacimonadota bacterium]